VTEDRTSGAHPWLRSWDAGPCAGLRWPGEHPAAEHRWADGGRPVHGRRAPARPADPLARVPGVLRAAVPVRIRSTAQRRVGGLRPGYGGSRGNHVDGAAQRKPNAVRQIIY